MCSFLTHVGAVPLLDAGVLLVVLLLVAVGELYQISSQIHQARAVSLPPGPAQTPRCAMIISHVFLHHFSPPTWCFCTKTSPTWELHRSLMTASSSLPCGSCTSSTWSSSTDEVLMSRTQSHHEHFSDDASCFALVPILGRPDFSPFNP